MGKLENTLALLKKKCYFFEVYCTTRKSEKTEKLNFGLFVFSNSEFYKKVELPEPTTNSDHYTKSDYHGAIVWITQNSDKIYDICDLYFPSYMAL